MDKKELLSHLEFLIAFMEDFNRMLDGIDERAEKIKQSKKR